LKSFWTQPFLKQAAIAALVSLGLHAAFVIIQWYIVSPMGYGGLFLQMALMYLALPLLVVFLGILVAPFLLLFRKARRTALTILICGPIYLFFGIPLIGISDTVRMHGFRQLALRSEPLVMAIQKYIEKEGRPPGSLQDLVPGYLAKVPGTGMPAYSTYRYSTETNRWDGNPWAVYVNCPSGGINFDMFMYFPMQNYPKQGYGGSLERVGTWAYVHE
jgi:hypothetical protein